MKLLSTIWKDIKQGENIDSYIAIIAALGLSVANIFGLSNQNLLSSITLAILALLAVANLGNRHRLDAALSKNSDSVFRKKNPEALQLDIKKAKELWLFGYHLTRTIVEYSTLIDDKLERGDKIKILLLDPNGTAYSLTTQTVYYSITPEQQRERINASLANLREISKSNRNNIEVRLIDYPFAFGVIAMNISEFNGMIHINHYQYKSKLHGPQLFLTPREEYLYSYYKEQILALWNDAKPYD